MIASVVALMLGPYLSALGDAARVHATLIGVNSTHLEHLPRREAAWLDPRILIAGVSGVGRTLGRMDLRYQPWAGFIITRGDPPGRPRMLPTPRRALVVADTYGRGTLRAELYVIATAPGWVCVRQDVPGRAPWNVWIPTAQATPV